MKRVCDSPRLARTPFLLFIFRYKEVQEQRFWQERLGTRDVDELGIDTNASFLADAVQPLPPGLAAPAPAPQPKAPAAAQHVPKAAPPAASAGRAGGKEGGIPIIIVPSGCVPWAVPSLLLHMHAEFVLTFACFDVR